MRYILHKSVQFNSPKLCRYSIIFCFLIVLLSVTVQQVQADSPPNLITDIPWTDTGGVFDLTPGSIVTDATFNGVEDTMAAFNHARREEEIQLGLATGTLGTLDLPSQAIWDAMSDSEKALLLLNEERADRAGMLPNVLGLPLEGIEVNINNVAQTYAQVLVDNDDFGHEVDGRSPWDRIDDAPMIGSCHEFLTRAENLAAFWAATQTRLYIERSFYNWIYADAGSRWGHREAAFLQDIPLNATDPNLGFKNNVGSPNSEGFLGIGIVHSSDYGYFDTPIPGVSTVVVMNFFDPLPSENCVWSDEATNTPVPTETFTPIPTPTDTSLPPTNTPTSTSTSTPTSIPTDTPMPTSTPTPSLTPIPTLTPTATEDDGPTGSSSDIHDSFKPETHAGLQEDHHVVTGLAEDVPNIDIDVTFNQFLSEYEYNSDKKIVEGKVVFDIYYQNPTGELDNGRAIPNEGTALNSVVIVATIPKHTLFDPTNSGFVNQTGAFTPQDLVWQDLDGSGPQGKPVQGDTDVGIRVGDLTPTSRGKLRLSAVLDNSVRVSDLTDIRLTSTIAAANLESQIFYQLTDQDSAVEIEIQRDIYLPIIVR